MGTGPLCYSNGESFNEALCREVQAEGGRHDPTLAEELSQKAKMQQRTDWAACLKND
jgi:hypothetical protein